MLGQPIDPARGLEDEIPLEISDFQGTVNLPRRVYIYIIIDIDRLMISYR